MLKRYATDAALSLADLRQVRAIASTEDVGRDGIIVRTAGIDLTAFKNNPVILFDHDPAKPIARAVSVKPDGAKLVVTMEFPDAGVSAIADETYGLIRAGVLNAISIGFDVIEAGQPTSRDGEMVQEIKRCELAEISVVSIPALASALVTERARRGEPDPAMAHYIRTAERYRRELGITPKPGRKPERRSMEFHRRMAAIYRVELGLTR